VVPVSISVSPVRDGSGAIVGAVSSHRDISARKAAEEVLACANAELARANAELTRANAELETLLRVLPVGIGIADDPAISRIRMNPAFAQMVNLPPEANASLGAPTGERPTSFRVYQGGRELAVEELPFNVAAATGREVCGMEVEVVREDGTRLTHLVNAAPLLDEEGRVRGVVGGQLDITALRELERAREDFLLAAAHDLRTPLTVIVGRVQLAQKKLERLGAPEVVPVVAQLGRALVRADGMLALIRELGEVAHLRLGGALDLQLRPTDLVSLVRDAAEAQRVASGRTIHLEAGPGTLRAEVDPERVGRVVGNLLANAVKYSRPGAAIGVRLGREEGSGGPLAVLAVRDEGVGIPAADLPHIFDRFRRASNVVGRVEGTGIGLASARAIVERHGGSIAVESVEGEGSTFTVRLPLRPPQLPGTAKEAR
jgi:signal transduction histidine kinase